MVKACWTGSYPCLCHGEWILNVNGKNVSEMIPDELRHYSMNTYGTYRRFRLKNYSEVWESYEDGLEIDEWIEVNNYWLNTITTDETIKSKIFHAIQAYDFRIGSCGGCI